ncbi:MAG: metallophosphoesterase [Motiliproteus sp.]
MSALENKNKLGKKLFTMVVVADTHLSEQDMESNSPFPVNRLANGRMKHVVQDINALAPEFVINLGDLIHPVPGVPHAYSAAVTQFKEQTSKLNCKQYLVPGNHDVGDKPIDWAPAGTVCDEYLALWEEHFGDHFYGFEQQGCHFLVVNAQIINTGLAAEKKQQEWLESYLEEHQGGRFFINIHYPPFLTNADEPEHYDNIGEPGRTWLLDLLEKYQVEALFAGHVHNFWFNRYANTDCYLLPSTAFVRQDYSEMYRVPPADDSEHGRNDDAKLGYFKVNVYEKGHVCHIIRTYGRLAGDGEPESSVVRSEAVHPAEHENAPLGFDLRQTWSEVLEIPPSGGLDEFIRKPVRNDYPLMAVWEMGVKKLRVPLQDLENPYVRNRMSVLQQHGQQFTVFSFGLLSDAQQQLLQQHQSLVHSWELAYANQDLAAIVAQLHERCSDFDFDIYLSRLRTHADAKQDGGRYYHVINHGFSLSDQELMTHIIAEYDLGAVIAGFVIRMAWVDQPWQIINDAGALAQKLGVRFSVHARLADENPAEANYDDVANANRIAGSLVAAMIQPQVDVFVDTFADNDRGYFVKNGVVDRRYNPRIGSQVVRNLYAELNQQQGLTAGSSYSLAQGQMHTFSSDTGVYALVLPTDAMYIKDFPLGSIKLSSALENTSLNLRKANLETGIVEPISGVSGSQSIGLDNGVLYRVPTLLKLDISG